MSSVQMLKKKQKTQQTHLYIKLVHLPPQFQQCCSRLTSSMNSVAFCRPLLLSCVQPSSSGVQIPTTHANFLDDRQQLAAGLNSMVR